MLSGFKCDKFRINSDLTRDGCHQKGYVFSYVTTLYNPRFCSYSTKTDFYRFFFVKLSLLTCEFNLVLSIFSKF